MTSVTFDITPPEFSFSYPSNDLPVNTTKISFKLSEELEKGAITWIATKGEDPLSPHTKGLEGDQKKEGEKLDIIFSDSQKLLDGVTYQIVISGTDLAGNKGDNVLLDNILFDTTPPEFVDIEPKDNAFIQEAFINYTLTEDLVEGKIYF